ncbi:MAG TPA: amidohydrolase family protein [Thermoanaerobaculia bacterium]|nr:amidohydrolase family protein [Thermoanaerobaculia bacterium]
MSLRRLVAVLLFCAAPVLHAEAPGVYAITGGTVHPVSGPAIANGTVIVRDGLIEAVGANVAVPRDATVIDVAGAHVYPGLIDAQTSLGFAAPAPRRSGFGGGGGAARPTESAPEPTPDSLALRNVKLSDDDVDARRAIGVTTIATAPAAGIFNGQSVVLNLGGGSVESRVILSPATLQISFNPRSTWIYPDSLMGVIAYIRQTFLDAQQHAAAHAVYERTPAGLRRPPENPALDALQPVLRRELPVVFLADSAEMILRVQALARELNVRYIISGARQAYELADDLKNVPVLVSVKWPVAPADKEDREDQPLRVIRDRQLAPTTPAALAKAGAQFALVSGGGKTGDFFPGIRKAIDNGLSADDALRATTLAPARILGIDRQLGSLERGKIANVVVSDKPLFDEKAKVTRLFVDGREIRLPREDKKAAESPASPIDGTWNVTVRAPQGSIAMSVTLHAEDGKLTGTYSGDRGSGEIRSGSFDGSAFELTISASAQNEAETTDWVFRGTLSADTMQGTVSTTLGTFDFSGSRSR